MEMLQKLVGSGEQLTILQMSVRGFGMFIITLFLIRVAGLRTFAKRSSFDSIIVIMLGAILARGVVGASPYWSTVAASVILVVLHRIVAWFTVINPKFEQMIKGKKTILYEDEKILFNNLKKTGMSENDLKESLRLECKNTSLNQIKSASMEANGRISFIVKNKEETNE